MSIQLPRKFYFLSEFAALKNLSAADLEHQIEIGELTAAFIPGRCRITPCPLDWNTIKMTPFFVTVEDAIGIIQNPSGYRIQSVFSTLIEAMQPILAPNWGCITGSRTITVPIAALIITPEAWRAFERRHPDLFPPPNEPLLHQAERTTLLAIIRALMQLHGIQPIKTRQTGDGWRKAAEALLTDLSVKGIPAPVKDPQTLAEKLREAFNSLRE